MSKLKPIVLSGPSGCGKSTIIKKLMAEHPTKFGFSVSHTTRKPRPGEVDGKDYRFTDRETMEKEVSEGLFIESAVYSNNMYGTSKKAVQDVIDAGRICLLDIDAQGVQSIKKTSWECILIFMKPPSMEELERRLKQRGTESEDAIKDRLKAGQFELEYGSIPGNYDYTVVNDNLEVAYDELKHIINKEMSVF